MRIKWVLCIFYYRLCYLKWEIAFIITMLLLQYIKYIYSMFLEGWANSWVYIISNVCIILQVKHFYRYRNWDPERLSHLPTVTQLSQDFKTGLIPSFPYVNLFHFLTLNLSCLKNNFLVNALRGNPCLQGMRVDTFYVASFLEILETLINLKVTEGVVIVSRHPVMSWNKSKLFL